MAAFSWGVHVCEELVVPGKICGSFIGFWCVLNLYHQNEVAFLLVSLNTISTQWMNNSGDWHCRNCATLQ